MKTPGTTRSKAGKTIAYGPQVDVRKEFIANLGNRITVVTDYDMPISVESERSVFAIEATNEKALAAALAKWMKNEPDVVRRELGQYRRLGASAAASRSR